MLVRDPSGAIIGSVAQVGRTPAGTPAAVLDIDGSPVVVPVSILTMQGRNLVATSKTRAELLAGAAGGLH